LHQSPLRLAQFLPAVDKNGDRQVKAMVLNEITVISTAPLKLADTVE